MEAREKARLNQVVCTLEGMCTLFQHTPGDFAVVIHGDRDCVNVLAPGVDLPDIERFYCTNLPEAEAVVGRSLQRLEACLELVCTRVRPQVVFVLGTCLTSLIGDNVGPVAQKVGERTGVPVVPLSGAGMRFVSQAAVTDRFARLMLDACQPAEPQDDTVNLVGFHPGNEVLSLLDNLGVTVNAVLCPQTPISVWKSLPAAKLNLVLDRGLFAGFLEEARQRFGQKHLEVPYPIGLRSTSRFFDLLLSEIPAGADVDAILAPAAESARQAIDSLLPKTRGTRLGYNIGSMKNLNPRTLALEGLVDLPVFEELGFVPVILVQGDDRPGRVSAVSETLKSFGCHAPMAMFSDTVFFADLCREQECKLVYASDHLREQVKRSGAGFVAHGNLEPGYSAVGKNIARVISALEERTSGGS